VNYFNPYWRVQENPGASDWIDARWSFQTGPGGNFLCGLLTDAVDAFALIEPEFAVGDVELGEEVNILCKEELNG
jgi:hypothetical protein